MRRSILWGPLITYSERRSLVHFMLWKTWKKCLYLNARTLLSRKCSTNSCWLKLWTRYSTGTSCSGGKWFPWGLNRRGIVTNRWNKFCISSRIWHWFRSVRVRSGTGTRKWCRLLVSWLKNFLWRFCLKRLSRLPGILEEGGMRRDSRRLD